MAMWPLLVSSWDRKFFSLQGATWNWSALFLHLQFYYLVVLYVPLTHPPGLGPQHILVCMTFMLVIILKGGTEKQTLFQTDPQQPILPSLQHCYSFCIYFMILS